MGSHATAWPWALQLLAGASLSAAGVQCAVAFVVAAAVVLVLGPWTIRGLAAVKAGQRVSTDAPQRHQAKQGTPTMGGILILCGAVLGGFPMAGLGGRVALVGMAGFGLLGFLDDYLSLRRGRNLGLRAREKLLGQVLLAVAAVWLLNSGGVSGSAGLLRGAVAALLVVVYSNAVNLTDGLDGLAAGLSVVAFSLVGALLLHAGAAAPASGVASVAPAAFGVAGSCAGFLRYNYHPARVFMGDTGSLALGAGLALCLLPLEHVSQAGTALAALLLVGLVFLVELLSVVIQVLSFRATGRRVFKMSPLHHHFELLGWSESQIVWRFWLVGLLGGLAAALVVRL